VQNVKILEGMVSNTDDSLIELRDRALLLTAYSAMCRRSELVSLSIEDVSYANNHSMKIKLRRSKADQDGVGRWLYINREAQSGIED